jgi:uncharacterized protein (TIGR02452 family)
VREKNKKTAEETMTIIKEGKYVLKNKEFEISEMIKKHPLNTKTYLEQELDQLIQNEGSTGHQMEISVTSETTLAAAKRLNNKYDKVAILNFASAKNPGGGFLKGSSAQEESIARSSSLYESINNQKNFYEYHRTTSNTVYSHRMIYSKDIVVIREDSGKLIEPYNIDVVTSAAVNVGALRIKVDVEKIMEERIERIIALFASKKQEIIVLGAFGCGVFKNEPKMIAKLFHKVLTKDQYKNAFKEVVFAIYERESHKPINMIFKNVFK